MKTLHQPILPSSTADGLGILGGGQLGRMLVIAAQTMGYRTVVFDPDPRSPAGKIASMHICEPYENQDALDKLARACATATVEFENIPASAIEYLQESVEISPASNAFVITQDRIKEKHFIRGVGAKTVAFEEIREAGDAAVAFELLSGVTPPPYILKSARGGYDGKYQSEVMTIAELNEKVAEFDMGENILEEKVELECELSVIVIRNGARQVACYPVARNEHRNGVLHSSVVPAGVAPSLSEEAQAVAVALAEAMDYRGVLGVEFFISGDGRLMVNEVAPRPHNSGHYTLDACIVSQFEQQARVMCGLPIGGTGLMSSAVMINLLGDLWEMGEPPWHLLLRHPDLKLHLYSKEEAKPGRKMGHFCLVGDDVERLHKRANALFDDFEKAAHATPRTTPTREVKRA